MKKVLFAALAAFALCACNNLPKTIEEYEAATKVFDDEFTARTAGITDNGANFNDELKAKVEEEYDSYLEKYLGLAKKVMKANKKTELADEVFKDVASVMKGDDFSRYLKFTSEEFQNSERVLQMKKSVCARENTAEGKMFVDFDIDGVKFSDFVGKGKYVLVDFWASWCGPCKREIPNIASVYEKYASDKFDVLSIAVWDEPEATADAAAEHGVVWNQIVNARNIPTDIYGIDGIPQIMLFGPDGKILKRDLRGDGIEAAVKDALGL